MQAVGRETIVALSSGSLPSGIAVIRISGPQTRFAVETICGIVPAERKATLASLRDSDANLLDRGIVLLFADSRSFTGEDSAEFQIHGGKAVVKSVLEALVALPGVRLAEAGEFSRRAFINGKLDLLQAEALADLISAETETQRKLAVRNTDGEQGQLYASWRTRLVKARALLEAELDFADEADVGQSVSAHAWPDIKALLSELKQHVGQFHRSEMVREGFDVVIAGPPNVGKSSLFNAIARRDVAIVSDEPGTTRDLLEVFLDLGGTKIRLTDTAGLRDDAGKVEALGIAKARRRVGQADLILDVHDSHAPTERDLPGDVPTLRLRSKADLADNADNDEVLHVSAHTGQGIDRLLEVLEQRAREAVAGGAGDVLPSRLRHVEYLRDAIRLLEASLQADKELELRAEDLRLASDQIGRIAGTVYVEDLLDVIFSEFCIGK